jgi:hypothetical protein
VMAADGWRSLAVMRRAYEHASGEGVYSATERPETPQIRSAGTQNGHSETVSRAVTPC